MLTALKRLFSKGSTAVNGKPLVDNNRDEIISWFFKNGCPCCEQEDILLGGPRGGMSQNVMCNACGTRYNLTPISAGYLIGDMTHRPKTTSWGGGEPTAFPSEERVKMVEAALERT